MQERRIRAKQTAFHFSWMRLPELHGFHLFKDRRLERFILQDHCGIILEQERDKAAGRITVPISPWRRLKMYLNDSEGTFDLVMTSIDPNRNFSHRVSVPRDLDGRFYYSATRDFLFTTAKNVWYDTELQFSLDGDNGEVVWILTQLVDRSEAHINQLFALWYKFIKNRERMKCGHDEEAKEEFRRLAHQAIDAIKDAWASTRSFHPIAEIAPDGDLEKIRDVMKKCFPVYGHYIDHPPEPMMFRRCPEREFRVEVKFKYDPTDIESDEPIYPSSMENIRLIIPPYVSNGSTPKRCFQFYSDVIGYIPDEVRSNPGGHKKKIEIEKSRIENSVEFWGDIAEVIKSFAIYRIELNEKLPPVIALFDEFRRGGHDKAVMVR